MTVVSSYWEAMSGSGPKPTSTRRRVMSAIKGKADMAPTGRHFGI
jgi:hypothetical protein